MQFAIHTLCAMHTHTIHHTQHVTRATMDVTAFVSQLQQSMLEASDVHAAHERYMNVFTPLMELYQRLISTDVTSLTRADLILHYAKTRNTSDTLLQLSAMYTTSMLAVITRQTVVQRQ